MNLRKLFGMCLCAATLGIGSNAMAWGGWTSMLNVFGGYNYSGPNGQSITSMPNAFGGFNYSGSNGMSGMSMPNAFGGYDYSGNLFRGGDMGNFRGWTSTPNAFGGYNYSGSNGQSITSMPNAFGGFNYSGAHGMSGMSMPNAFGGYDYSGNLFRGGDMGNFRGWTSTPNAFGGYNYSGSNGQSITSMPNAFGGFNYSGFNGMSGMSMPNAFGGFNYSGNLFRGGDMGNFRGWTSTPNVFGGYNYSSSNGQSITSMPNVFGGFNYSSPNGMSGTSMPNVFGGYNYSGDLFRGQSQNAKSFFTNEVFRGKIDEAAITLAIKLRNINALLSSAWDLRGFEIVTGMKDDKLTSEKMFSLAAQIAVEQNNADALKAVIALAPECKKYEEQLAFRVQTHGAKKSSCATALPELVYLPCNNWDKILKNELKDWQQPVADLYLAGMFRGMSTPIAAQASFLINNGRATMNPVMLAAGAATLANFEYQKDFSPRFEPASIMAEAVELAIELKDKVALEEVKDIYAKSALNNPDFSAYIDEQLAMLGNTRGINAADTHTHPGDFSLSDIRKILFIGQ